MNRRQSARMGSTQVVAESESVQIEGSPPDGVP
jgi:hypothetical protein